MERMDDTLGGTGIGGAGTGGPGANAGEVHARVSSRPAGVQAADQGESTLDRVRDRAEDVVEEARDRAGEIADRARRGVENAVDRAEDVLEERTGALSFIRNNPLPAVGIAFAAGFLLAGSGSDKRSRRGVGGRVRNQVRGAVMAAVSAAVARELRNLAGLDGEGGGLLDDLLGGGSDREERSRTRRRTAATTGGYGRASTTPGRGDL
jgi:ElaB/YqjD/DUF883 family membrane-anchored ribosome-binding protein